jgi:EpsI family protein
MRKVIIIVMTTLAALAVFKIDKLPDLKNQRLLAFPLKLEEWYGNIIGLEDWVYESLETPYVIMRDYRNKEGGRVNLAIVWYSDKEIAFHAPEACLGGVGNLVKKKTTRYISKEDSGRYAITELRTERNDQRLLVYYYYVSNDTIIDNELQARWQVIKKKIFLERTSVAMVRIIVAIDDQGEFEKAKSSIQSFFWDSVATILDYTRT